MTGCAPFQGWGRWGTVAWCVQRLPEPAWFWSVHPAAAVQAPQSGGDIALDAATVNTILRRKQLPWGSISEPGLLFLPALIAVLRPAGSLRGWPSRERNSQAWGHTAPDKPPQLPRPGVHGDVDSALSLPEWSAWLYLQTPEVDCGARHLIKPSLPPTASKTLHRRWEHPAACQPAWSVQSLREVLTVVVWDSGMVCSSFCVSWCR